MTDEQGVEIKDENHLNKWSEHCFNAVCSFVKNAVVIDNEPSISRDNDDIPSVPVVATPKDDGMSGYVVSEVVVETEVRREIQYTGGQKLYIRETSDAFAKFEIACSFVLPKDVEVESDVVERVIKATRATDIVVIDWYLKGSDPLLTKTILRKIAVNDVEENGRLRLICIYTGQPDTHNVLDEALSEFNAVGLPSNKVSETEAKGTHHYIMVLKKNDVAEGELPKRLLEAMAKLTEGLLPTFALAAVAAVRQNVHHIVTQFSSDLDAAFVANRLITDPPGDVAELMKELFVSECDTALGLSRVLDEFLDEEQIIIWLNSRDITECEYEIKVNGSNSDEKIKIDKEVLIKLLKSGLSSGKLEVNGVQKEFPEAKREKVSQVLHDSKRHSEKKELLFSRKIALKREAFGSTKLKSDEGWLPALSLGTLLKASDELIGEIGFTYLYCVTPICDTVRLADVERTFVMVGLAKHSDASGKYNLVVLDEDKNEIKLNYDPKPRNVRAYIFKGSTLGRVLAEADETQKFYFSTSETNPKKFLWLGEVRGQRASRDMADLNRDWLRLGINDSEFLRLKGKK